MAPGEKAQDLTWVLVMSARDLSRAPGRRNGNPCSNQGP